MTELLNTTLVLTPEASSKNLYFSFYVPNGCNRLTIEYAYSPKMLNDEQTVADYYTKGIEMYASSPEWTAEDIEKERGNTLSNLVTLSLDGPMGYVGAAHRHAPQQTHLIDGEQTTPGFEPVAVKPGLWRIGLNVHAVVTPICTATIIVKGE